MAAALRDGSDYLDRAVEVVRAVDVPLPEVDAALRPAVADEAVLAGLERRWGLAAPVGRLRAAIDQAVGGPEG